MRRLLASPALVCSGGPSGFGLPADRLLCGGGGVSPGAAARREGGRGGMPVIMGATSMHRIGQILLRRGHRRDVSASLISTTGSVILTGEAKAHRVLALVMS